MSNEPDNIEQLRDAIHNEDPKLVDDCLKSLPTVDSTRSISRLSDEDQSTLLRMLDYDKAAHVLEQMPEVQAAHIIETLDASDAAGILNQVDSDEQADILSMVPDQTAANILQQMEPEEADGARRLMQYPPNSAGGLMITEYLAYDEQLKVEDLLVDLRTHAKKYREYNIQYAYVVNTSRELAGVLRLRDILLADPHKPLASLMIPNPHHVRHDAELEELERFFESTTFLGVPVVDDRKLIGVVRRQDVEEAAEERASQAMLKFTGILGGEELRTMPIKIRSFRRLSWLSINIVLNLFAASIIAMYQDTLAQVIALAVFLPIISDMSGCSGNQAVAVSMRELSLGLIRPNEFFRVLYKEAAVGFLNGIALGLLLGMIAYFWKGMPALGLVVAIALFANTIVAVCIGGCVPLILKSLKQDPALASGPILTTVTDMCGFFLVLSLANAMLPWLT